MQVTAQEPQNRLGSGKGFALEVVFTWVCLFCRGPPKEKGVAFNKLR